MRTSNFSTNEHNHSYQFSPCRHNKIQTHSQTLTIFPSHWPPAPQLQNTQENLPRSKMHSLPRTTQPPKPKMPAATRTHRHSQMFPSHGPPTHRRTSQEPRCTCSQQKCRQMLQIFIPLAPTFLCIAKPKDWPCRHRNSNMPTNLFLSTQAELNHPGAPHKHHIIWLHPRTA